MTPNSFHGGRNLNFTQEKTTNASCVGVYRIRTKDDPKIPTQTVPHIPLTLNGVVLCVCFAKNKVELCKVLIIQIFNKVFRYHPLCLSNIHPPPTPTSLEFFSGRNSRSRSRAVDCVVCLRDSPFPSMKFLCMLMSERFG